MRKLALVLALTLVIFTANAQYLHRQGKYIVDGQNNEVILRSMGLGGWMLQEPYMLNAGSFAGTQNEIRSKIENLIGKENTDKFYDTWLRNHCTKTDIDSLSSWGFNSVRLPLHYNLFTLPIEREPVVGADTWLPKGFAMVDSVLAWCTKNNMYLILDLHAAPGGQGKDAAISDYDKTKPSLWESAENRRKTVALWAKLAEKYANEPMIGGYDLLNEANWDLPGNTLLKNLYLDITKAIRAVDKNHILFIEGNWFANDFTGLTPPWDTNMAYSFHKYWNSTDQGTIQYLLDMRNTHNVPLWLGESGENNNQWFYETIKMLETNRIGWSWWPMKKFGSITAPLTVVETKNYKSLVNYLSNGGTRPDITWATNTLLEMAENTKIENCIYHPDYLDPMFRQQKTDKTKPFRIQEIPGVITATDYDMGKAGKAYSDLWVMKDGSNDNGTGNNGWNYRNDGVDIEVCSDTDPRSRGFNIGWIDNKEWTQYTIDVQQSGAYSLTARYASGGGGGTFHLDKDGVSLSGPIKVGGTGGWQSWKSITIPNVVLYEGIQNIKFIFDQGGYNLNFVELSDPQPLETAAAKISNIETSTDGYSLTLYLNKNIDKTIPLNINDFSVKIGTTHIESTEIEYSQVSPHAINLKIPQMIVYGNVVKVSYSGSNVKTEDGSVLPVSTDIQANNNTAFRVTVPGKIEAEKYLTNFGLSKEVCTDAGGGENMGYTNNGDYIDYLIWVPSAGTYSFEYRLASTMTGSFDMRLIDDLSNPVLLHTVNTPNTGGWQTWKSVSASAKLSQGAHTLRLYVKQAQFNFNWFKISLITGINNISNSTKINIYPNPTKDFLYISAEGITGSFRIWIINMNGTIVKQFTNEFRFGTTGQINISDIDDGFYIVAIDNEEVNYRINIIKKQ
jgi:endoglucanase